MDDIKDLLGAEIETEIKQLSNLNPGSKERSTAVDDLTKLYKLRIEETKNEAELQEKVNRREMEQEQIDCENILRDNTQNLEIERLQEQVKDRYFRVAIAAAEIGLPLIFYAVWMRKGFKFEETGTFTSNTFRGLFNRFKPTK